MPNWCENSLSIYNPKVFKEKCMKDGKFMFENIIPQPEHIRVYNDLGMSESDEKLIRDSGVKPESLKSGEELINGFFYPHVIDFMYAKDWLDSEAERTGVASKDWYEWDCENWGTKWDLDGEEVDEEELEDALKDDSQFDLFFSTAWAPPLPVLEKMAELGVEFDWHCEEGGCGIYMEGHSDGESFSCWDCDKPEEEDDDEE